ncbi:unnamed protein product, partial [Polarella glacialis]
ATTTSLWACNFTTQPIMAASGSSEEAPPRTPARSASAPGLDALLESLRPRTMEEQFLPKIGPSEVTRQMQYKRNQGRFFADAPRWQVDSSSAPVLPSREKVLSRAM